MCLRRTTTVAPPVAISFHVRAATITGQRPIAFVVIAWEVLRVIPIRVVGAVRGKAIKECVSIVTVTECRAIISIHPELVRCWWP